MSESKRKIIFIIPFAMPNAGKSHLWKLIQETLKQQELKGFNQFIFKSVSSDEIRSEETKKKLLDNPKLNYDKAFENSRKPANQRYD